MNIEKAMARAIQDHSMIQAGDSILIGASGGKDSLALSWLFARMAANMAARAAAQPAAGLTVPLPAGMTANVRPPLRLGALKVLIGPDVIEGLHEPSTEGSRDGLPGAPEDKLSQLYDAWGIPLRYFGIRAHVESMDTRDHLDPLDRLNARSCSPLIETVSGCYRCSSLRREALASHARQEGYSTIALGHHLDDILTTALMNLVTHGDGPAMQPCRNYDKLGLRLIRPLAYVPEESIKRLAARMGWDSITCTCPAGTAGDRAEFRRRLEVLCGGKLSAKLKLLKGLGIA